jgi:hypothetical protein
VRFIATYRGPTAAEALARYHAEALARAREGWVPLAVERPAAGGVAELSVTYQRDPAAVAEVIEVLEAILEPTAPVR